MRDSFFSHLSNSVVSRGTAACVVMSAHGLAAKGARTVEAAGSHLDAERQIRVHLVAVWATTPEGANGVDARGAWGARTSQAFVLVHALLVQRVLQVAVWTAALVAAKNILQKNKCILMWIIFAFEIKTKNFNLLLNLNKINTVLNFVLFVPGTHAGIWTHPLNIHLHPHSRCRTGRF